MSVLLSSPLADLRKPAPHFQRAIHIRYDLNNPDVIAAYVPTARAADALARLLRSLTPNARQRAFVLHGPYGSGKSLLVTVLAAIFSRDLPLENLAPVLTHLEEVAPETALKVQRQLSEGPRLLPVVLYGDEGDLASSLLRALFAALRRIGWEEIRLATHYRAALETLQLWQKIYPETYQRLSALLQRENWSLERLTRGLQQADEQAYEIFQRLYPTLTAGATFNHYGHSVIETYQEAIRALAQESPYTGIAILWDEFGRFLEARTGDAFGREAALLQELAEFANHSGETPLYLVLVTHKAFSGYFWNAPPEHIQEWRRIGERFLALDVSGEPPEAYRLIAAALTTPDETAWQAYLEARRIALTRILDRTVKQRLFPELDEEQIRDWIVKGAYPLHPLTVYALPRLSSKVAQNERTLFTFLTADDPLALPDLLKRFYPDVTGEWVGPEVLYDYFAEAMRVDTGPGGVSPIWANAEYALNKTPPEESLNRRLVKALAVLEAIGTPATTATLAFALQVDTQQVEEALNTLVRRKILRQRRLDHTWELMPGSSIDLEAAIQEALERRPTSPLQLRRLLEQTVPPPIYQARQHNLRTGMTRFFWSWYRYPEEIGEVDWETVLKGMNYADGLIIYLLARTPAELQRAQALAQTSTALRVVFVVPPRPLADLDALLHELSALLELKNDPVFREQDPRVSEELDFFVEDTTARLRRALTPLIDPWESAAEWYWQGERYRIRTSGEAARLVSHVCDIAFPHTPELHNDPLNRRNPTAQQIRAAEQVIDALLTQLPSEQLGITGFGPDWLILHTVLRKPGILRQDEKGSWIVGEPHQPALAAAWRAIEAFLERARQSARPFSELLDILQSPPFGLRLGVLPLLIAAVLRKHLAVVTIRRNGKAVFPITGALLTDICCNPRDYTLELGPDDEHLRRLWAILEERFGVYLAPEERRYPPIQRVSTSMMRWLRSLPRFAQVTRRLSPQALEFRRLIEASAKDPAPVLFEQLPTLLGGLSAEPEALASRLEVLKGELETAYLDLLRRAERFVVEEFAPDANPVPADPSEALQHWMCRIENQAQRPLDTFCLEDGRAQDLVKIAQSKLETQQLLEQLAQQLVGVALRDWNDAGEEHFYRVLREARTTAEREILGLATASEDILEIQVRADGRSAAPRLYRFRPVPLSEAGQRILQNFKSTLETTGRVLSADEKRQLVLSLLEYVLGKKDA